MANKIKENVKDGKYRRNNGKKPVKRQNKYSKDREYSRELECSKEEGYSNDPKWYATDEALLRDAASYPFSWATGPIIKPSPVDLSRWASRPEVVAGKWTPNNKSAGGLGSIYLLPSIGCSVDKDSPINIASFSLFSYVRHANSGNSNYDAVDLMQYVLAMSSVYSYINFCQRLYGLAFNFSQRNSYMPEVFFAAVGIDYNDIRSNLANFRLGLNILINQAASFAVPNTIPLLVRQSFVYTGLYTEGTSIKDQMYMYNPSGFWYFDYDTDSAGVLRILPFYCNDAQYKNDPAQYLVHGTTWMSQSVQMRGYQFLIDYGTYLMRNLVNNQDFKIMSGDITKAFGSNTISLASVPEIYQVTPEFNIGVLEQMCNATVLSTDALTNLGFNSNNGTYHGAHALDIFQGGGHAYLTNAQYYNLGPSGTLQGDGVARICALGAGKILTTTTDSTDPGLVMESSRLMLSCTPLTNVDVYYGSGFVSDYNVLALNSGSEVANRALYFYTPSETTDAFSGNTQSIGNYKAIILDYDSMKIGTIGVEDDYFRIAEQSILRQFRFRNAQHFFNVDNDYSIKHDYGVSQSMDNYTLLGPNDIYNLHRSAIINQVNVPYVHKV